MRLYWRTSLWRHRFHRGCDERFRWDWWSSNFRRNFTRIINGLLSAHFQIFLNFFFLFCLLLLLFEQIQLFCSFCTPIFFLFNSLSLSCFELSFAQNRSWFIHLLFHLLILLAFSRFLIWFNWLWTWFLFWARKNIAIFIRICRTWINRRLIR